MKQALIFLATLGLVAGLLAPALRARDRELQTVLTDTACTPASITSRALSPAATWYEVACRGGKRTIYVLCRTGECWLQPTRPENDEPTR
jgi:hypothetical protein